MLQGGYEGQGGGGGAVVPRQVRLPRPPHRPSHRTGRRGVGEEAGTLQPAVVTEHLGPTELPGLAGRGRGRGGAEAGGRAWVQRLKGGREGGGA